MQRPILIATLGLLTGIIGGLYFQNIVPFIFLVLIFFIYYIKKLKKKNSFFKIVDLLIKKKVFLFFFIAFLIGNLYFLYYHHRYEAVYQHFSEQVITATIVSQPKETEYQKTYKIKLKGYYPPIYFLLRVSKNKKINLNYGDQVKIEGEYEIPEESRNEGGWNYREYLKTQSIYGIFKANTVQLLKRNQLDRIALSSNIVKQKIIYHMNQILPQKTRELFLGILIGYDEHLQAEIAESFQKSSLSHLLAVSGAHISYIVIGTSYLLSKLKIPKKIRNIFIALFLVFFMYLTSFTPSVMRASIMGIISILAFVFGKKYDLQTSMSISILLILMYNPYQILDIGLLLSYFATIGIISFLSFRKKRSKQDRNRRENKIVQLMKELVGITIFANIFVMPITLYHFNTISLSFILSNLVAGILIGPITIGGFIIILLSFIHLKFAYILSIPYELLLEILIDSTQLISKFPLSEILVPTPPISILFLYYFILFLWLFYQQLKENFFHRYLVKKIIYFKESCLTFFRKKKFFFYLMIVFVILLVFLLKIIPKDLTIYFIDVGQGDSSLIVTPQNKKILIDSGGQSTDNFDVGKSTLLPYLLDKGVISLDYIFISHFDADHCQGFIYLLNHLHIKNIILARQPKNSMYFQEIVKLAKEKKIKVITVSKGNTISIEKGIYFEILWPDSKQLITENVLNNNSMVCKLNANQFSMLFTGDIEEIAEKAILAEYRNHLQIFNATILKVAHHGSQTSTTQEFLEQVKPRIALIGVGKNNQFGHPSEEIVSRLKNFSVKIYRTDLGGEITIRTNCQRQNKCQNISTLICIKFYFLGNNIKNRIR